jgi:putative endonuclease
MYVVYVLYSQEKDRYYIGFTGDEIDERLRKHNSNHKGFTGKAADWRVVYTESLLDKSAAIRRELEIKRWKSRKRIEDLILNK